MQPDQLGAQNSMYRYLMLFIVVFVLPFPALADNPSIQELQDQCETAREAKLAPERETLIQVCIQEKTKSAEYCQRFYADYGAGGITVSGAGRARLYNDLPECEALYDAEKGSSKR